MSVTLKVCIVTAALNLSQTFSVIMALRRSRRLQQLQPEETNLGVCLICQGDFTIEVLHRLRKSDCCETLFHRCCFSQMMEHTSRCPACRHEHEPENPRALELPDDLDLIEADSEEAELQLLIVNDPQGTFATLRFQAQVSEEIYEYRSRGLPVPHRLGSPFWPILPYFIPEHYFFTYLSAIESFSQIYVGNTMYIHGFVVLPVPLSIVVRQSFYENFLANMPWALFRLVHGIRFPFYFHYNPEVTSIRISQMHVLPFGEPNSYYESDAPFYL